MIAPSKHRDGRGYYLLSFFFEIKRQEYFRQYQLDHSDEPYETASLILFDARFKPLNRLAKSPLLTREFTRTDEGFGH